MDCPVGTPLKRSLVNRSHPPMTKGERLDLAHVQALITTKRKRNLAPPLIQREEDARTKHASRPTPHLGARRN